jgi:hypothetical protein
VDENSLRILLHYAIRRGLFLAMKQNKTETIMINGYEWRGTQWSQIYYNAERDRFALCVDGCIKEVGYLDHCIATRDAIASFATA